MTEVKYVCSNGKEYNLIGDKLRPTAGTFHDYAWEIETAYGINGYRVESFKKAAKTYQITLTVRGELDKRKEIIDDLTDAFEVDVISKKPGGIYFGDWYIDCYITAKKTSISDIWNNWTDLVVDIYCQTGMWIREETRSFPPISSSSEEWEASYLDYEHDYPYDYTMPYGGDVIWTVDHYAPCEFLMTIFGPAADPRIVINGHPYQIYTTLDENEYLKIDSRNNQVIKYLANGIQQDIYDLRAKQESVFDPITPGNIRVVWSGEFGFDITLYCERSEPKWKTQNS